MRCAITSELPRKFVGGEVTSSNDRTSGESSRLAADFRCFALQDRFIEPNSIGEISPEIMSLLNYMYRLASVYKSWNQATSKGSERDPSSSREKLAIRWSSIRSSLLGFPSAYNASVPHAGINDFTYESIRLAVIILSRKGVAAMDPTHVTINTSEYFQEDAKQLRAALEKTRLFEFWEPLPGALIWCLAICVNVCENGTLKNWFLAHLSRTAVTYALIRFKQLHECMMTILHGLRELKVVHE